LQQQQQQQQQEVMHALGAPQGTDVVNFVSLGFGGQITLTFDYLIYDKPGTDLTIVETSYSNPQFIYTYFLHLFFHHQNFHI
jgi:hypothetical protein